MKGRKINLRKVCIMSYIMLIISAMLMPINAYAVGENEWMKTSVSMQVRIDLHDADGNVIAYYHELSPSGYVIVRSYSEEVIEYSEEPIDYFNDVNGYYYYGGPLRYYKESNGEQKEIVEDLASGEIVPLSEISRLIRGSEADKLGTLNIRNFLVTPKATGSDSISYSTAKYKYNPDGRCGSVAGAIVLKYYDQHKSSSYIPASLESTDGTVLIKKLVDIMGKGTTYTQLKNGLNVYLKQYYKPTTVTATTYSWGDRIKIMIGKNYPCIIGLTSNSTYGAHWAVVTGYNFTSANTGTYTINDGHGRTGVKINSSYTDGCVDIG